MNTTASASSPNISVSAKNASASKRNASGSSKRSGGSLGRRWLDRTRFSVNARKQSAGGGWRRKKNGGKLRNAPSNSARSNGVESGRSGKPYCARNSSGSNARG